MDIQKVRKISAQKSESALLAKQARLEKVRSGQITTTCPMCKQVLMMTTTSNGERTTIKCGCGYVRSTDINF